MEAQLRVPTDGSEVTAALTMLEALLLAGAVLTGDAAFRQRAICRTVRDRDRAYLFAVEADRPDLMTDLATSFGDAFPSGAHPRAPAGASVA